MVPKGPLRVRQRVLHSDPEVVDALVQARCGDLRGETLDTVRETNQHLHAVGQGHGVDDCGAFTQVIDAAPGAPDARDALVFEVVAQLRALELLQRFPRLGDQQVGFALAFDHARGSQQQVDRILVHAANRHAEGCIG